jgi:hypothetical protein
MLNTRAFPLAKLFVVLASCLAVVSAARGQPGWVLYHQKISETEGDFTGILDDADFFGGSTASLGDLDGDGVGDLAVAAGGATTVPCGCSFSTLTAR